jgi:NitT/TauT family transport system substrate-binding protein
MRLLARAGTTSTWLLVLWCCAGVQGPLAAQGAEPIRVGLTREVSAAPFLVAADAGYFAAADLELLVTFFSGDRAVVEAVVSGKVDIGLASLSAPFYRDAAAHHLKIIASRSSDQTMFPMYALLVSSKAHAAGLSGVRGLPNSRIGVAATDVGSYYGLFSIAARFKLDANSIKAISLKSNARELDALSRGEVDAALLPFQIALESTKGGRSLLRLSDFSQWQEGVVFSSADTILAHRGLIERFIRAYRRGASEYRLNFLSYDDGGDFIPGPRYSRYLAAIARGVQASPDLVAKTKTYCDPNANLDVADIEKQVEFWQQRGNLDSGVAAASLLDLSFLNGAKSSSPP